MLDADVSDAAFRLYAVLARYGNTSGVRMPGRALLARRLRKSVDTVDRALRELTAACVLEIERRQDGNRHLTNRYHLRTHDPAGSGRTPAATASADEQVLAPSSRMGAATPAPRGGGPPPGRPPPVGMSRPCLKAAAWVRPPPPLTSSRPPLVAADLRRPLPAPMRPGWPQPCGPTQRSLPRPLHPPPRPRRP